MCRFVRKNRFFSSIVKIAIRLDKFEAHAPGHFGFGFPVLFKRTVKISAEREASGIQIKGLQSVPHPEGQTTIPFNRIKSMTKHQRLQHAARV